MATVNKFGIRVVVLGDEGSGKTALVQSWLTDNYPPKTEPTIGVDSAQKEIKLSNSNENVNVLLWDTSGKIPEGLLNGYFSDANLCFITVDATLTRKEKLLRIKKYRELIKKRLTQFPTQKPPRVVVIETKLDAVINHAPVYLAELNQNDEFIPVEKVISVSAKENIRIDMIANEIMFTAQIAKVTKVIRSAGLLSCFSCLFSGETKPVPPKYTPNTVATMNSIKDLSEANARDILCTLGSRLLEGAITDKNKEPYEVSIFGNDYVEYTTNDAQRRKIKIPKTVAAVIAKIQTVINDPPNSVDAKKTLAECYQDILKAANSSRFTRYKSTQNFYENVLPEFIEKAVSNPPMQLTDFEIIPRSEQSSISP